MNEEELINKVLRELDINPEWHKKQELRKTYGSKFVNSVIKLSFQKGKLEQKKENIKIIKRKQREAFDNKLFKVGYGWNNCAFILLKQLSKEIGEEKV